jgi:16S rRNA (cytosine967-C5)-methyltransferase
MNAGKRAHRSVGGKGTAEQQQSAGASQPRVSPARRAAFEILRRVEEEGSYASVMLASEDERLKREDRALCYEIVMGVLRHQLWLDKLLEHYTGRGAGRLDAPVRRALRMGLYQLRFLSRIPPSAIVNESVNLAHMARVRSASGLINAALRRAAREPEYDPAANLSDEVERAAVRHSHPLWLVKRWVDWLGLAEAERLAEANNLAPPVAFRVVRRRDEDGRVLDELRAAGAVLTESAVAPSAWRVEGGAALVRRMALEGRIYIQDEASQLVAHVLGAKPGELILDACAAPGSKTTHVADMADDRALIVAGDLYGHRLRALLDSAARQGLKNIRAVTHDAARALAFAPETFDRVLVDAPCIGTGTLRRNPEIRWRITAEDLPVLQDRQALILRNSARMVGPRGRLVYSTCSVEPEENEAVLARFLAEESGWRQIQAPVPETLLSDDKAVRTWPHRDGSDGFFMAVLERD